LARRLLALGAALWLLSGVYVVRADEQAVVRRFGRVIEERVPPGLHLALPWGVDRVDRLKVREQKRLTVGFEAADRALGRPAMPGQREFFTGDQNLVNIELLAQYTIREPRAYLFAASDGTALLRQAVEAAVVEVVAARPVDPLLTTGQLSVQEEIRQRAQALSDGYGLGIAITAVSVQAVTPPLPVSDAFRAVASAREDRDRIMKEAESYANASLPAARGEADRRREEALGYRDQRIRQARGDADRFLRTYAAYRMAPTVTRARLYLETVEEILPRMKVITIDRTGGRSPVELNLLPKPAAPAGGGEPGTRSSDATPAPDASPP
jgi:membrane protease subunit HflK